MRGIKLNVLCRLLLLGEIASALPDLLWDRYPGVAWRQIRAFRNLAVHKYFSVDWAVVWQIAQEEVPLLEAQAMDILRAEFPDLAKTYEQDAAPDPEDEDDHQRRRATGPGPCRFVQNRTSMRPRGR